MLEAKDLPVCELSEFLQHRLNIAVQNEHLERAKQAGATHHSQVGSFLVMPSTCAESRRAGASLSRGHLHGYCCRAGCCG